MKWLGIDIAKRKFDLAVLDNGKIRSKVFENTLEGYEALLDWLATQDILGRNCMPAWKPPACTTKSWRPFCTMQEFA